MVQAKMKEEQFHLVFIDPTTRELIKYSSAQAKPLLAVVVEKRLVTFALYWGLCYDNFMDLYANTVLTEDLVDLLLQHQAQLKETAKIDLGPPAGIDQPGATTDLDPKEL